MTRGDAAAAIHDHLAFGNELAKVRREFRRWTQAARGVEVVGRRCAECRRYVPGGRIDRFDFTSIPFRSACVEDGERPQLAQRVTRDRSVGSGLGER